jgi:hypothetical protein
LVAENAKTANDQAEQNQKGGGRSDGELNRRGGNARLFVETHGSSCGY